VKKVLERRPTRAITVFVDMKDIDKAVKKVSLVVSRVTNTPLTYRTTERCGLR
jgi:hypothetical protein